MIQPICEGKCENCEEEDRDKIVPLFKVQGRLMCADCANQWSADMRQEEAEQ